MLPPPALPRRRALRAARRRFRFHATSPAPPPRRDAASIADFAAFYAAACPSLAPSPLPPPFAAFRRHFRRRRDGRERRHAADVFRLRHCLPPCYGTMLICAATPIRVTRYAALICDAARCSVTPHDAAGNSHERRYATARHAAALPPLMLLPSLMRDSRLPFTRDAFAPDATALRSQRRHVCSRRCRQPLPLLRRLSAR